MEFGFKEILQGFAGISLIIWAAVIGLSHTYMFPRFFRENTSRINGASQTDFSAGTSSSAISNEQKPWFTDDQGMTLNPAKALTAIGLKDRGTYSKKSFVVANFNPVEAGYGVNRLHITVLIAIAISSFVLITYGLQSGFGLIGVTL